MIQWIKGELCQEKHLHKSELLIQIHTEAEQWQVVL